MIPRPDSGIPAIVLGLDLNGLGVVRALGQVGIAVIGVDNSVSHVGRASRYCKEVIEVDPCSPAELIDALQDLGRRLDVPGVLFPTMDDTVRILSQKRGELPSTLRLALPEASMVTKLMEKVELADLARDHGWPVPATAVCRTESEVAVLSGGFPCPGVMKPGRRDLSSPRGIPQKVWCFRNSDEIRSAYAVISRWESTVVLQELIPGPDSAVLFCLFYSDETATPRALFVGRKMRQYPPLFGSTSSAEPIEDERVRSFAVRFIRDTSFRGLGSVEMKLDTRSGAAYFIEPTVGRTDYQSFLAVANGVNIPEITYRDLAGLPAPPRSSGKRRVKYIVGLSDFRSGWQQIRSGMESWSSYLLSLRGPKAFALFQLGDLGPWIYRLHYFTSGRALRVSRRVAKAVWKSFCSNIQMSRKMRNRGEPRE